MNKTDQKRHGRLMEVDDTPAELATPPEKSESEVQKDSSQSEVVKDDKKRLNENQLS